MSSYYINAILLNGCPYSIKAKQMLQKYNIKSDLNYIDQHEKEKYKTPLINTFPQIYLKKYNNKNNLLLGGYSELYDFITRFKDTQYNEEKIQNFISKTNWSKKATLR